MKRKTIAIIALGLILLASLLACGYFGVKTIRRTQLRRAGMTAYEQKDYMLAERLLQQYVQKDPNAEAEFVALANIYREFGNTGMEAQMWQTASSLNPLNGEYRENMLNSAVKAASYPLLYSFLGRKAKAGETFADDRELYLYVISAYRSGHQKDGDDAFQKAVKADPEAFHKNELGRMAEFIANYSKLPEGERDDYLNGALQSEDPVIKFEALYTIIRQLEQRGGDDAVLEKNLKQIAEINYFAGTPLLADFYFSKCRFEEAVSVLKLYLEKIDDIALYLLYAESCVFTDKLDEVKALRVKLLKKSGAFPLLAEYCDILIAYMENDEEKLAAAVRKSGKFISSPLSRFICLRVAMSSESFNEIRAMAQELFSAPSFYDLHNRALLVCLDYLSEQMQKPENQRDPSQMAELAKILSAHLQGNRLLTEIILVDQYRKGLAKEVDIMTALNQFPDDAMLQRIAAEFLILNGKSEQALGLIEKIMAALENENEEPDRGIMFLHVLALDQLGRHDEAKEIFGKLLEQSEFDMDLLTQYFLFCVSNKRQADLAAMADNLDKVKDGKLKQYGTFFRAAALLVSGDEFRKGEALDMLVSTSTDDPEFTFYAANRLCENGRLDEAETKYKAILKSFRNPPLVLVNLSELYHDRQDAKKALETAKEAYSIEKQSMLPAFIYARRLSEAGQYEEAVAVLNFPRHAVNYRDDVVELWADCMRKVIEKNIASERYQQAEENCKHLLVIVPEDEFGEEKLVEVRKLMRPKTGQKKDEAEAAAS